jgi:hypothetical protein
MHYLTCDHCLHANEVKSEYLTFCEKCGKKIQNNFKNWQKENPGGSFEDFKNMTCRTSILHWEPDEIQPKQKKRKLLQHSIILIGAAASLTFAVLWASYKVPELANSVEKWAQNTIQFGVSDTDLWQVTVAEEGNFQVRFPVTPVVRVESSETVMGTIAHKTYLAEPEIGSDNNLSYSASYMAYPLNLINSRLINKEQVDEFLKYTIDGIARSLGATLMTEKDIAYGLFPGKEVKMDYQNGMADIKCRLYLVDNVLYTLKVTSPSKSDANKTREYFLNSFKLIKYADSR